jgi:hypothetical protein
MQDNSRITAVTLIWINMDLNGVPNEACLRHSSRAMLTQARRLAIAMATALPWLGFGEGGRAEADVVL